MATQVLEITVRYGDGKVETLPNPERNDEVGRKVTRSLAWELIDRDDVDTVNVNPTSRYAGGRKGTYR